MKQDLCLLLLLVLGLTVDMQTSVWQSVVARVQHSAWLGVRVRLLVGVRAAVIPASRAGSVPELLESFHLLEPTAHGPTTLPSSTLSPAEATKEGRGGGQSNTSSLKVREEEAGGRFGSAGDALTWFIMFGL
ncbi:unnamed protein product [Pleuronectes platessa]|uniref:Uncharacterized protein n=1 Tax=Pleuronectes platessa TaxID=8262 RepID=A0A9N7YP24_PLEPL|nr:unnamed protein product [Pleuronectes platessa]